MENNIPGLVRTIESLLPVLIEVGTERVVVMIGFEEIELTVGEVEKVPTYCFRLTTPKLQLDA